MNANVAQQVDAIPKAFAEFPSANWTDILCHAREFSGATNIGLFAEGDDRPWVDFDYKGRRFWLVGNEDDSRVTLNVDDESCESCLLLEVQRHFANLLLRPKTH